MNKSHCTFLGKDELTVPMNDEKPYNMWTGLEISLKESSEPEPKTSIQSEIGSQSESVDLPPFTFFSNPLESFTFQNQPDSRDLDEEQEMRNESIVLKKQKPIEFVLKEFSNQQKSIKEIELDRLHRKIEFLQQEREKLYKRLMKKNVEKKGFEESSNDFKSFEKDKSTSIKLGSSKVTHQEIPKIPHQTLLIKDSKRYETSNGKDITSKEVIVKLDRNQAVRDHSKISTSSKGLFKSRNENKDQNEISEVNPNKERIKINEIEDESQLQVPMNSNMKSFISIPKESIIKSTHQKITESSKDESKLQKEYIPNRFDWNDRFKEEDQIKNEKNFKAEPIKENVVVENKVKGLKSQSVYTEGDNPSKTPSNWEKTKPRNKIHKSFLDEFENGRIGTSTKIGTEKGDVSQEIDVAFHETSSTSDNLKEDLDAEEEHKVQDEDHSTDLSSEDQKTDEKKWNLQGGTKTDEILEENLISPQHTPITSTLHNLRTETADDKSVKMDDDQLGKDQLNLEEANSSEALDKESEEKFDEQSLRDIQVLKFKRGKGKKSNQAKSKRKHKLKSKDKKNDELMKMKIKGDEDQIHQLEKEDDEDEEEEVIEIDRIDKKSFLKELIRSQDQTPMLKVWISRVQFECLRAMGFDSESIYPPLAEVQMSFKDPFEAYRRIISLQRQFDAIKFTYGWKEEEMKLPSSLRSIGKMLRFDEPFPDFREANSKQLDQLDDLVDETGKESLKILKKIALREYEKRVATIYMIGHDDTYIKASKVLQDALAKNLIKEGYILPVLATIDQILELSSNQVNWHILGKEQITQKVHHMLDVMHGVVNLQDGAVIQVFRNVWKEEPTRALFTINDDPISKRFTQRMKYLSSLADQMNLNFPEKVQIEKTHSKKLIRIGEYLISQHVGLSVELLRKFKIWLNFKPSAHKKKKSCIIGSWEHVPEEFLMKGHLFKDYFHHRFEKVEGLDQWNRETDRVFVNQISQKIRS
ncbi:hypothetical protein DFH28DRAFT_1130875 [Melampsora americana]|nr:hypothetical protein DFH28DRAFT_1130875 [Melampsora americana]